MTSTDPIAGIAGEVMRGVARSGAIRNTGGPDDNVAAAVTIIRAEIKALIAGDAYADAREAILAGTLHETSVLGLVIANCVARLHEAGAASR